MLIPTQFHVWTVLLKLSIDIFRDLLMRNETRSIQNKPFSHLFKTPRFQTKNPYSHSVLIITTKKFPPLIIFFQQQQGFSVPILRSVSSLSVTTKNDKSRKAGQKVPHRFWRQELLRGTSSIAHDLLPLVGSRGIWKVVAILVWACLGLCQRLVKKI